MRLGGSVPSPLKLLVESPGLRVRIQHPQTCLAVPLATQRIEARGVQGATDPTSPILWQDVDRTKLTDARRRDRGTLPPPQTRPQPRQVRQEGDLTAGALE